MEIKQDRMLVVGINKQTNECFVSPSRDMIAKHLGISLRTLQSKIIGVDHYLCDDYELWLNGSFKCSKPRGKVNMNNLFARSTAVNDATSKPVIAQSAPVVYAKPIIVEKAIEYDEYTGLPIVQQDHHQGNEFTIEPEQPFRLF